MLLIIHSGSEQGQDTQKAGTDIVRRIACGNLEEPLLYQRYRSRTLINKR